MEAHLLPRSPSPRSLTNHFTVTQVVSMMRPLSFIFYIYLFVWDKEVRNQFPPHTMQILEMDLRL